MAVRHRDVDDYVRACPDDARGHLEELRALVHECVPGAEEKISYQIPTLTLDGAAVLYFAAWKKHLSIYPVPRGDAEFEGVVAPHRAAKDAVHLGYDRPVPHDVVERIAALLVQRHTQPAG